MSNVLPTIFSDYFEFNFNIHYNTRQCSDLHINTVKRSKSLRHNGPRIWNCLNVDKTSSSPFANSLVLSTNLRASIGLNITREVRKTELGSYSVFKKRTVQKLDIRSDGMPIEAACLCL